MTLASRQGRHGLYALTDFDQIPVLLKSAIGFSWYCWAVKDDLLFDELNSANLNYLAFTTKGICFDFCFAYRKMSSLKINRETFRKF